MIDELLELRPDAVRLARAMVRTDEVEDVVQDAMLKVWRRLDHVEAGRLRPYLMAAVRNTARNLYRSRRRQVELSVEEQRAPDPTPGPDALIDLDEEVRCVVTAYPRLSATDREVLALRYVEALGFPAIARRLGISAVAARQRAHRARANLAAAYQERLDDVAGELARARDSRPYLRTCTDCGDRFERPRRRGRPSKRCPACRGRRAVAA